MSSAAIAQLVRAPDCGSGGPPFEPGWWYHLKLRSTQSALVLPDEVSKIG